MSRFANGDKVMPIHLSNDIARVMNGLAVCTVRDASKYDTIGVTFDDPGDEQIARRAYDWIDNKCYLNDTCFKKLEV